MWTTVIQKAYVGYTAVPNILRWRSYLSSEKNVKKMVLYSRNIIWSIYTQTRQCIRQHLNSLFMLWKIPITHELRNFGCDIFPITTSSPKHLYDRTQEGLFMRYTNSRATMQFWGLHTKKLKYGSSDKFDEHNNKFGKWWSPSSESMIGTNISTIPTLKLISKTAPSSNMIYLKLL